MWDRSALWCAKSVWGGDEERSMKLKKCESLSCGEKFLLSWENWINNNRINFPLNLADAVKKISLNFIRLYWTYCRQHYIYWEYYSYFSIYALHRASLTMYWISSVNSMRAFIKKSFIIFFPCCCYCKRVFYTKYTFS
jgi:hypothetical protein